MHPLRRPPIAPLTAAVALALVLAACSGTASGTGASGTAAPTTTAPGTASARLACASISPAQVRATTGAAVGRARVTVRGSVATCTYPASGAGQPVVIQYASGATPDRFAAEQGQVASAHGPLTSVTGLGDEAYSFAVAAGGRTATTLVVRTGSLQFLVTSTSPLAQVEGLAQLVLYTVGRARSAPATTSTSAPGPTPTTVTG